METAAWLPTELDKEASALIDQIDAEFVPQDDVEVQAEGEQVDAGASGESPVTPPTPKAVEVKEELSDAVKRELGLYQREQALVGLENEIRALRLENESYRKRELPEDALEGLRSDTTRTLEAMGLNPDQVVRQILAERMGDSAPAELRDQVKRGKSETETARKIRALEEKLAFQEQASRAQAYFAQVQDGARKYITEEGINEHAPTVAKVAKRNSERVFAEIMEEIQANARENAVRNPKAPLLTYEEAARRVERRWSELSGYFTPENPTTITPEAPKTQAQNTKTPPNTGSIKPPDRPLAPWLQKSTDIENDGLRAAIAEYRRLETPGKQG